MKQNDSPSAQQAGKTMLNADRKLARPTAYDKAIAFSIADRIGEGESLEAILEEPGMPDQDTFFGWLQENPEASHRLRVKQQVRELLAEQEKKKRQAKYRPRRWTELYPLIGPPPVLSTENAQSYADLLTAFTEMLQPEDIMAQILVKEAVDATWEEGRYTREKTQLPERTYREYLEAQSQKIVAQRTGRADSQDARAPASGEPLGDPVAEPDAMLAKAATPLDHARGLEMRFPYYQSLGRQQLQAAKRRATALRELERWNEGLGREARQLSDRFVWAETMAPACPSPQAGPPLVPSDASDEERK